MCWHWQSIGILIEQKHPKDIVQPIDGDAGDDVGIQMECEQPEELDQTTHQISGHPPIADQPACSSGAVEKQCEQVRDVQMEFEHHESIFAWRRSLGVSSLELPYQ